MARHAYGTHPSQVADLVLPDGDGPFGVAVLLHGGFWRQRYGADQLDGHARDLAARGWAALNVEYRRVGGGGGVPRTLDDVGAAIDLLADVDAPLDLERVVTIGHSAGGHLALWAATRRHPRVRVAAAVGQAAVSDLDRAAALDLGDSITQTFCGGTPGQVPDAYACASPARRLPLGVPVLLVHGTDDDTVPASMSEGFAADARATGDDDVTLVLRPGEGHFEHLDLGGGAWADVLAWLEARR